MNHLSETDMLLIGQQKEWGEILTGFETKNKYMVSDADGNTLYGAAEKGGSMLLRWFLKAYRPFTLSVFTHDGQEVIQVRRLFRFYFHRVEIYDTSGVFLGSFEKKFSLLRRYYKICDASGTEVYQLCGPLLHPWTFEIKQAGKVLGKITKKWSGTFKEVLSDADNFAVSYPREWSNETKALMLGGVFLIDFVHFENKGN